MKGAASNPEFRLIQGLRGIAALWVVLFHIEKSRYISGFSEKLPAFLHWAMFDYGRAGVAVFFVLSGFVISHSLAGKPFTGRDFGRFVARRSIRLDPPYWLAISLSIAVTQALNVLHNRPMHMPSATNILAHLFYAQQVLNEPEINVVFWTLTYEIQFYLFFALLHFVSAFASDKGIGPPTAQRIVMMPATILAGLAASNGFATLPNGTFLNLWHAFFLGVLAYRSGYLRKSPVWLFLLAAITVFGALGTETIFGTPAALTAIGLWLAARKGFLANGLGSRALQSLGTISYSLYLFHVPLAQLGFGLWGRIMGRGAMQDSLGFVFVLTGILAASAVLWWLIERPSHNLAKKLFRSSPAKSSPAQLVQMPVT